MERREIVSSTLPKLNGTTKDLINSGIWFLYGVTFQENKDVKYCLCADQTYLLDKDGSIISKMSVSPSDLNIEFPLTFSDLPKPSVSTNSVVSVWD